jgi:copper transport protein
MWFSEPLETGFSQARVLNSLGEEIPVGSVQFDPLDPNYMRLLLKPLAPGIYTIAWQTLSQADGHSWYGSFPITLLHPDGSAPTAEPSVGMVAQSELPTTGAVMARWFILVGGILLFGSRLVLQIVVRPGIDQPMVVERAAWLTGRSLWLGSGMVLVGSGLQGLIQAQQLGGLDLLPGLIGGTRTGALILVRFVLVLLAIGSGGQQVGLWLQRVTLIAGAAILLTLSIDSHANAVTGSIWAILIDYIHFIAAAIWVGGLVMLPGFIWRMPTEAETRREQLLPLIRRFAYLAGSAVFVLASTGLLSSLIQLPTLADLWATVYGRTLSLKLGLVGLTLWLAFFNHRLAHHPSTAPVGALYRLVPLEAISGLTVLLVTAALVQSTVPPRPPPQASQATATPYFSQIVPVEDLNIHTQVVPNRVGENQFIVHLYHDDGSAIGEVQLVRLFFNYRDAQLGQAQVDLKPDGGDLYRTEGAYLNQAGAWEMSVYVRRRGMDDLLGQVIVHVAPPVGVGPPAPWQNPIPIRPIEAILAGPFVALGLATLLWRPALRQAQPRFWLALTGLGLAALLVGSFFLFRIITLWLSR